MTDVLTDRFDQVRDEFPLLANLTYLNAASRGPLRREVAEAACDYYTRYLVEGPSPERRHDREDKVDTVRRLFAQLIGADPGEVAYTKNITEGINIIAQGLRLGAGDNVIFVPALEHPTIVYALAHLRDQRVELRLAQAPNGDYDVDAIVGLIDSRTRMVCVSTTSFLTGARAPLRQLSDACHAQEAILLVDGAQGLGILDLDVEADGIDALAGSAHKGLLGMHGIGFLYCRKALAERINPVYLGRNSVRLPDGMQYFAMGELDRYELAPGARRFDLGHANVPAIYGLEPCLTFLLGFGADSVEKRVLDVSGDLITGLSDLGIEVVTPRERSRRGGTVSIRCGDPDRVNEHLTAARVVVALRKGLIRFGLHLYNNQDDVQRVLDVLGELPRETLTG